MDSPRLLRGWRRGPADDGPAENTENLAARTAGQAAADEITASQPSAPSRADPESTEAMQGAAAGEGSADGRAEEASPDPAAARAVPFRRHRDRRLHSEKTRPIGPTPRSRVRAPDVALVDGGDSPAELIKLLVPEQAAPVPPPRRSLHPGELLAGRYLVQEEVGGSGAGLVYKALDRQRQAAGASAAWVALKLPRPVTGSGSEDTAACLRREFLNLARLNHPNVVHVFDYVSDRGLDFVVLEWLDGEPLSALLGRITSRRIALEKAADIVRRVAGALAHAHSLGIVHGDVKPANIFLGRDRSVKLLDFGSAGPAAPGDSLGTTANWATRAYASCEVLNGQAPTPRDDVYALGVTAYRLLCGGRPYGDRDACEARQRNASPPALPEDAREHAPAVLRALALAPMARQQDAEQFLREFDEPWPDAALADDAGPAARVGYGAIAAVLLISLVAWSVGSVGDPPANPDRRLAEGRAALAEGRLAGAENSAEAHFRAVLEAEPDNAAAGAGLREIAEAFLVRARAALASDDGEAVLQNLERAREVLPGYYGIVVTEDLIARHGRDLAREARLLADRDPLAAELALARAGEFLSADDPALRDAREHLVRTEARRALESLLSAIDERILAERLILPVGDSAVDLLRSARGLAPGDPQVARAAERIATALLFQSMFAASNGDIAAAERYLAAARRLDIRHMALVRAQYEIAKARRAQVAARRAGD